MEQLGAVLATGAAEFYRTALGQHGSVFHHHALGRQCQEVRQGGAGILDLRQPFEQFEYTGIYR